MMRTKPKRGQRVVHSLFNLAFIMAVSASTLVGSTWVLGHVVTLAHHIIH